MATKEAALLGVPMTTRGGGLSMALRQQRFHHTVCGVYVRPPGVLFPLTKIGRPAGRPSGGSPSLTFDGYGGGEACRTCTRVSLPDRPRHPRFHALARSSRPRKRVIAAHGFNRFPRSSRGLDIDLDGLGA